MDELLDIAIKYFGPDYTLTSTDKDAMFCCPFCYDKLGKVKTDRKLGVCIDPNSKNRLRWHCFRCGSSGRLEYKKKTLYDNLKDLSSLNNLINYIVEDEEPDEYNMVYLPKAPIEKDSTAYKYLINRGINDEKIEYYQLRLGKDLYTGRVIIPNKMYGENWCDVFQARDISGKRKPKYLNPAGIDKSKVVFNLHRQPKNPEELIIVEGAITAICGGKNCIGMYGCHPSSSQLDQTLALKPKNLICCLDNDAAGNEGMKQLVKDIINKGYKGNLYYVNMPKGKDAADLGEEKFQKYVKDNKKLYDEFTFNLNMKLL